MPSSQISIIIPKMLAFLCDDLNLPGMFGVIFDNLQILQTNEHERTLVKQFLQEVLGLTLQPLPEKAVEITQEMQQLIVEREVARAAKDWKRADELRGRLRELGYEVQDRKN